MKTKLKHTLRDTLIRFFTVSGLAFLLRACIQKKRPLVRVIAFHDVLNRDWFEEVIRMLAQRYHMLSPQDFEHNNFNQDRINVLVTFDDGYQSWIDTVKPVLEKYKVHGIFFVCSGLLDVAEDSESVNDFMRERLLLTQSHEPLTWDGTRLLADAGHTIAGHTTHHVNVATSTRSEASAEVRLDRDRIAEETQTEPLHFAFPFGRSVHIPEDGLELVQEKGYRYVYSAESGFVCTGSAGLIPRTLIEDDQSCYSICAWIEGGYDLFRMVTR